MIVRRSLVLLASMAALSSTPATAEDDKVVQLKDDPYRRVVLENAVVRVWEVKVPVGKATIRCESDWTEYYWQNYADHFTFGSPTVGVTLEIEFPYEDIDILGVSFQKEVDSDQIKQDNPRPGLKTWVYPGVMLTGQRLWIQWQQKATTATSPAVGQAKRA